ncbi:protein zwilch homolog isoform X2 [Sceloporus undulatus]|uniref:protein zwilch homolog isoform X2 n=1 Tax=Sceloporus undulatus TaxID=8520 RepID=UPI001C4D7BCE|nr:protein zwilch homolog isoform X2 [Sceloporus undulatus]
MCKSLGEFLEQKRRSDYSGESENNALEGQQVDDASVSLASPKENPSAFALPVSRARQLISFYTMSQNPNMSHLERNESAPLPPLWVRCDGSDPKQTIWMGAEPLRAGSNPEGILLHSVTCVGPVPKKKISADLEKLKENHRMRHHSSDLTIRGFARYEFLETTSLESLSLEDTLTPLERNIYADFTWNNVTKILQTPPLTSVAILKVQMASGSTLSSVYELNRELQFLLSLAESLKTGTTDWPKRLGQKPAIELVQKLLKDLKDEVDGLKIPNKNESESPQDNTTAAYGSMKALFSRRGDLDFVEQLWSKIWANIVSYEELVTCFTLVMKSLQCGELQAPVHQGSNSLLSKLIRQSYHGNVETVSLSGDTPIRMLLEIGVDKLKRDYVSYFVGKELATRIHLEYFLSTSVELQEQVHHVQKLHHMLEIVHNCVELLKLEQENLIFLTQSCINYYKEKPLNEKHVFQLPVKTAFVKEFYQNAYPQVWRVEISSGQGLKKVRTMWQFSTSPPAQQMNSSSFGLLDDTDVCGHKEEMCFITMTDSCPVYF